jgi:hypothetical protein
VAVGVASGAISGTGEYTQTMPNTMAARMMMKMIALTAVFTVDLPQHG